MKIPQTKIDEIASSIDIVDVISAYTPLRKAGRSFMGRCPFHEEKTPSFSVSQEKGVYHCFGCGKSGKMFTLVMDTENVNFFEAVKMLAEKDGDREGSAWFSEYTHLIALVARREGEKIPFNPSERETWLQNRATIFQDVPLDVAMDVDFFLTSGLTNSKRHTTIIGSLLLPLLLIAEQARKRIRLGQTPSKKQKAKRVNLINVPGYGGFTAN